METIRAFKKQNPGFDVVQSNPNDRFRSREGDVKWARGKRYVRRQEYSECYKAHMVRRGRSVYRWTQEDHPTQRGPEDMMKQKTGEIYPRIKVWFIDTEKNILVTGRLRHRAYNNDEEVLIVKRKISDYVLKGHQVFFSLQAAQDAQVRSILTQ